MQDQAKKKEIFKRGENNYLFIIRAPFSQR